MKKVWLRSLSLGVLILVTFSASGLCQPRYGGTLTVGMERDISAIDPHKVPTTGEGQAFSLMCNGLVEALKFGEMGPGLAESWKVSADSKEWTFFLRKNVKFHNGRELTAKDIKFNLERILDTKTASTTKSKLQLIDSIKVVDPYTVTITLKSPSASFLSAFSGGSATTMIIAPECVKEDGTVTHPIGTGPFEFEEWKHNEYLKFKKFKDYWDKGRPYLDRVVLKIIPDDLVRLTALKTGEIDLTSYISLTEAAKLKKQPDSKYQIALAGGQIVFFHFNCSKPPFNDPRVRRAVAYALNKEELTVGNAEGLGSITNQPFVRESKWFCDVPEYKRDVKKAKDLLKEAGYPSGLNATMVASPAFHFMMVSAEILQQQLKEVGINVKLDITDWTTLISRVKSSQYEMGVISWSPVADPDVVYPMIFPSDGPWHCLVTGYDVPQLTELLNQARMSPDFNKRKELYTKVLSTCVEDSPIIFTNSVPTPHVWAPYVKGYEPQAYFLFGYSGGGLQFTWLEK